MSAEFRKFKVSISDTIKNTNGKTSASGFIGVIMGFVAMGGFISGLFGFFIGLEGVVEVLKYSINLGFLSAGLLGVRKAKGFFQSNSNRN